MQDPCGCAQQNTKSWQTKEVVRRSGRIRSEDPAFYQASMSSILGHPEDMGESGTALLGIRSAPRHFLCRADHCHHAVTQKLVDSTPTTPIPPVQLVGLRGLSKLRSFCKHLFNGLLRSPLERMEYRPRSV